MTYKEFITKLQKLGFRFERQAKGSHEIWYHSENDIVFTVPHHAKKSMSIGVIKSFLKITRMPIQAFHKI